jgi:GMP/IMP 5'-nucleotidase
VGAKYNAVTIDPKTAMQQCETLLLDMDGTILDLAFDNYVWKELVPERYARQQGIPLQLARDRLFAQYLAIQGDLEWYCLDHWSERLGFDVLELHRDVHDRIVYLPGARAFLERVREQGVPVYLVTNSHPDTLALKDDRAGFSAYFDGIYCSHTLGFAKEKQEFWQKLRDATQFDPASALFVDDTEPVLRSAEQYGIGTLLTIGRPDTTVPPRIDTEYVAVEGVAELLA